jgi:hypothetical protein
MLNSRKFGARSERPARFVGVTRVSLLDYAKDDGPTVDAAGFRSGTTETSSHPALRSRACSSLMTRRLGELATVASGLARSFVEELLPLRVRPHGVGRRMTHTNFREPITEWSRIADGASFVPAPAGLSHGCYAECSAFTQAQASALLSCLSPGRVESCCGRHRCSVLRSRNATSRSRRSLNISKARAPAR